MTKKVCEILDSNSYDLILQVYDDDAYQKKKKKTKDGGQCYYSKYCRYMIRIHKNFNNISKNFIKKSKLSLCFIHTHINFIGLHVLWS